MFIHSFFQQIFITYTVSATFLELGDRGLSKTKKILPVVLFIVGPAKDIVRMQYDSKAGNTNETDRQVGCNGRGFST